MDLSETGIPEVRTLLVRAPGRRYVAAFGIRGQEEHVSVATRRKDYRVGKMRRALARHHVTNNAVNDDHVEHLGAREHLDRPGFDLATECLISTKQQLLPSLPSGVEGARNLSATEGAIVEQPAVLAGERDPLCHALIDDVDAQLRQPIDVRLTRSEVAALHRVIEQSVDAVAVVLVALGGIDTTLSCDAVGAPRTILVAEAANVVAKFA